MESVNISHAKVQRNFEKSIKQKVLGLKWTGMLIERMARGESSTDEGIRNLVGSSVYIELINIYI